MHSRRTDEKLGLILRQVTGLRARVNSLALQHGLFWSLAVTIGAGALIYLSAYLLSPLVFLAAAAIGAVAIAAGLWRSLWNAWRMRASLVRAAELADERAELRGRLVTIVQTPLGARRGPLWPYLVEDTLGHRDDFVPARIERRRVSRAILPLVGSLALAALAIPLTRMVHPPKLASSQPPGDITLDLNDLEIRPAEPGDDSGLAVQADPATMSRLADKLAREGIARGPGADGGANNLLNRARRFAGHVQSRLRGDGAPKQRLTLRLADAGAQQSHPRDDSPAWKNGRPGEKTGQFKQDMVPGRDRSLPPFDPHSQSPAAQATPGESSEGGMNLAGEQDSSSGPDSTESHRATDQARADQGTNGGLMHGIGSEPDTLFGAQVNSKLGDEGFEIAIQARPMEHGATGSGHAYLPPKVRTPLAANQAPDQPVTRAEVPPDDRSTIKRVFER
jgi:hypothetical protein